ncbi:MAG: radical SAM protein [Bacteroidetes bacterium]|nr:radical SAM protein [Bacteroidota bacterium]
MSDTRQYHLGLTLKLRDSNQELTLSTLRELAQNNFNTDKIQPVRINQDNIPAAGFYLSGLLRENGYDTILSNKWDDADLQKIASENPLAVCLSSTMILNTASLREILNQIRKHFPDTTIIVGGVFVWKCYQFYLMNEKQRLVADDSSPLLFQPGTSDIKADIFVVSPHGKESLLLVLREIENGHKAGFSYIPNLAFPDYSKGFLFTERKNEEVDYNTDFTRWDLIDELPGQIPFRTSIGCPWRCRYCDFYQVYPRVFLRSKESLGAELHMIRERLGDKPSIIHATDDNVFINAKRVTEVSEAIISSGLQRWIGFMRASSVNKKNINIIRRSGLLLSIIGVESGDKGQLERMNKSQKLEDVKNGIELLDNQGITVVMTFIVGFPGETGETISNTANFLNNLNIGTASSNYQIYPLVISPFSDLAKADFRQKWNITGLLDKWSHYTMNSDEAVEYGYDLFRQVTKVPYHYSTERTFYNREAFSDAQRKILFTLRQQLTLEKLRQGNWEGILPLLKAISDTLGFPPFEVNEGFGKEIILR